MSQLQSAQRGGAMVEMAVMTSLALVPLIMVVIAVGDAYHGAAKAQEMAIRAVFNLSRYRMHDYSRSVNTEEINLFSRAGDTFQTPDAPILAAAAAAARSTLDSYSETPVVSRNGVIGTQTAGEVHCEERTRLFRSGGRVYAFPRVPFSFVSNKSIVYTCQSTVRLDYHFLPTLTGRLGLRPQATMNGIGDMGLSIFPGDYALEQGDYQYASDRFPDIERNNLLYHNTVKQIAALDFQGWGTPPIEMTYYPEVFGNDLPNCSRPLIGFDKHCLNSTNNNLAYGPVGNGDQGSIDRHVWSVPTGTPVSLDAYLDSGHTAWEQFHASPFDEGLVFGRANPDTAPTYLPSDPRYSAQNRGISRIAHSQRYGDENIERYFDRLSEMPGSTRPR